MGELLGGTSHATEHRTFSIGVLLCNLHKPSKNSFETTDETYIKFSIGTFWGPRWHSS